MSQSTGGSGLGEDQRAVQLQLVGKRLRTAIQHDAVFRKLFGRVGDAVQDVVDQLRDLGAGDAPQRTERAVRIAAQQPQRPQGAHAVAGVGRDLAAVEKGGIGVAILRDDAEAAAEQDRRLFACDGIVGQHLSVGADDNAGGESGAQLVIVPCIAIGVIEGGKVGLLLRAQQTHQYSRHFRTGDFILRVEPLLPVAVQNVILHRENKRVMAPVVGDFIFVRIRRCRPNG